MSRSPVSAESPGGVPPPITQVMDAAQAWLPGRMGAVETRLRDLIGGHGERLGAEAAETLDAGGKRLRPMLVLLCGGREAGTEAIRAAAAIELVHMATLVHDDVLDDASLRRGSPTVVARAGRPTATAVGDLLLSRAFAELTAGESGADRQVALLAGASLDLARGELAQRHDAFDVSISPERYLDRCRLKTASLFECACLIGRPGDAVPGPLAIYGVEIGLAFQLLDDVLDVTGPPERTGKARGTDLRDGTVTLPVILARERDPGLGTIDLRDLDPSRAEEICDRIVATGVLEQVRGDARSRIERAKALLATADLEDERRELLALVADGVVERYA